MEQFSEQDFNNEQIKKLWDEAVRTRNIYDIGQQYEYCLIWWRIFKGNIINKQLVLVTDFENDNGAIWPLMSRRQYMVNGLYVIGQIDGFITDYAIPVCTNPGLFIYHLDRLARHLRSKKLKWDFIKLNVPQWSELLPRHSSNIEESLERNFDFLIKEFDEYSVIHLGTDFESYIASLGVRTRADIKRYLRIYNSFNFRFKILEGNDILANCIELVNLNSENWSVFKESSLNIDFLKDHIKCCLNLSNGKLIMPVLYYENTIIAAVLGFIGNAHCFLHTAGISRKKVHSLAPGITLYSRLIQYLIEQGIETLDLSPGIEDYKIRLGARSYSVTQLVIFRNYPLKLLYKTALLLKRLNNSIKVVINKAKAPFHL